MSVTLHIVNLWNNYVCCTRSGVTRCTFFTLHYLGRMCKCGLRLEAHRYAYALPRERASQYRMTFIPMSEFIFKDLGDSVFDVVELAGFKSRTNAFLLA